MQAKENFELVSHHYVKEYQSDFYLYSHKRTKARVLFIENDDENKVFNISFRTPVDNSKGIPHILEHSVLNGSKNYPLKEPFVNLIKSSLKTFLNAMTYPDRTCYPVASTNQQDLYNLTKVYLDAVFNPLLDHKTFLQEGWHYELDNDNQELSIKGVVYNEMKGVFSDQDSKFVYNVFSQLFPDNTYNWESGGDPDVIPQLTYQEFLDFHSKYYHPTNSYIFYYGNDKSDERFELIDSYLSQYDYQPETFDSSNITRQDFWSKPKTYQYDFDPGNLDNKPAKSQSALTWIIPETNYYKLMILEDLLMGNPSSILYKSLMESGYGDNLSAGSGFEDGIIQSFFSIGMQGVDPAQTTDLHDFIEQTFQTIVDNGFDPKDIEAAINSIEFSLKEFNSTSQPKGLSLILNVVSKWIYDQDYLEFISYQSQLDSIKDEYKNNPNLFSDLVQELILDNSHKLIVTANPKPGINQEHHQQEQEQLEKKRKDLSQEDIEAIESNQELLEEFRAKEDSPEDLAKLPTLQISDLEKNIKKYPYLSKSVDGVEYQVTTYPTNDIVYNRLTFDIKGLNPEELKHLPLLLNTFKYLDTKNYSNQQLNQELDIHTGNFSSSLFFGTSSENQSLQKIIISGKALSNKNKTLLSLIGEVLTNQILDNQKIIKQLLNDNVSSYESSFVSSGYQLALSSLKSELSDQDYFGEITGGLTQYYFLKDLQSNFDNAYEGLLKTFQALKEKVFTQENLLVSVTASQEDQVKYDEYKEFATNLDKYTNEEKPTRPQNQHIQHKAFIIPSKINFVCKGINLYEQGYEYDGSILPISRLIDLEYLWNEVRAKGGAYGCYSSFDKYTGVFSIFSFRDPQLQDTLNVYAKLHDFLSNYELTEDNKKNLIISSIGMIDKHLLPSQVGPFNLDLHLKKVSDEQRQLSRDQIFGLTHEKIQDLAKYFKDFDQKGVEAIFTHSPKDLPKDNNYSIKHL